MSFDIEIGGMDRLMAAFQSEPEIAQPIIQRVTDVALLSLIPDLASYPAPPNGSTYRRTGTLGRLWAAAQPEWQAIPSGFEGSIGNATPYGVWVQDAAFQARRMKHWKTDTEIVEKHTVDIQHTYEAALHDVANAIDKQAGG